MTLPAICSNLRPLRWNKIIPSGAGVFRAFSFYNTKNRFVSRAFYQDESRLATNVYDFASTDGPKNGNCFFDLAFFVICNSFITTPLTTHNQFEKY